MQQNVTSCRLPCGRLRGFSLIELMTVVIVIGVLAAIAYPSFMGQVRKSRRAEAVDVTSRIQQAQERWRANQPQYAAVLMTAPPSDCDTAPEQIANSCLGIAPLTGARYTYALAGGVTAVAYTLTATAVAGSSQASDSAQGTSCAVLTVTVSAGNAVRTPPACWSN